MEDNSEQKAFKYEGINGVQVAASGAAVAVFLCLCGSAWIMLYVAARELYRVILR